VRNVICDPILIRELEVPGSDVRCGVNLICRPSQELAALAAALQRKLRSIEPNQYYYPTADLHLTVFEISHSLDPQQAAGTGERMASRSDAWSKGLESFQLRSPRTSFDERGCALRFEDDERFGGLRRNLSDKLSAIGIQAMPRSEAASPHITFMRYLRPLTTDSNTWLDLLSKVDEPPALTWNISELWLTWGATWFGMRRRIVERGPYRLA